MPYPNAYQIEEMFANRSNPSVFNTYFSDSVDVIVVGQDFHLGGRYNSIQDFHNGLFERTVSRFKDRTYTLEIVRVIGGGESAWYVFAGPIILFDPMMVMKQCLGTFHPVDSCSKFTISRQKGNTEFEVIIYQGCRGDNG